MRRLLDRIGLGRPELRAWAMYDWANSSVQTTIIAAIFPIYFQKVSAAGLTGPEATGRFAWATTIAIVIVAVVAPLLGAVADRTPIKKRLLAVFLGMGAAATAAMFFLSRGDWQLALALFIITNVGVAGSIVFYDSLLPHIVSGDELDRVRAFVAAYCESALARRLATEANVEKERHFSFLHDGVILHGFLDVLALGEGRALVVDYKTNTLAEGTPEAIVDADYRLQRLVYALACFRAGASQVEVAYAFLDDADAVVTSVFTADDVPALEAELSAAIGRIRAGDFVPTPSDFACPTCPALGVVCAGPKLRNAQQLAPASAAPA
jgi:hypothetical protein